MTATTQVEKTGQATQPVERLRPRRAYVAPVDIVEKPDELVLLVDVPGAKPESINLHFERGTLSIHAAVEPRQDEHQTRYLVREYGVGDFDRTFQVGDGIDAENIGAEYRNGVLTVHLPKAAVNKPRKIAVTAS